MYLRDEYYTLSKLIEIFMSFSVYRSFLSRSSVCTLGVGLELGRGYRRLTEDKLFKTFYFLYNILCTANTQHTSRQDAIITVRLYLATCFDRDLPSSNQLRTIFRYSKTVLNGIAFRSH